MPRKKTAPTTSPQLPLPPPTLESLNKVEAAPKRRAFAVNLTLTEDEHRELEKREWADVREQRVFRLAFEGDPYQLNASFSGLFKIKLAGIPDPMLKRVAVTESLVAALILARQHHMAPFGRPQKDRHSLGFKLVFEEDFLEKQSEEDKKKWEERAKRATKLLRTCGHTSGWDKNRRCSLGSWFKQTVKSALTVGRIATEIIYDEDGNFHSFRPQDAGCIYPAVKTTDPHAGDNIRERSETLLRKLHGDPDLTVPRDHESWDRYDWDRYDFVQVIDGQPVQVFTADQMLCKNFYETPDYEWGGFPVTPLDTAVSEVLTRMSITSWNKIYFQHGRAAKGMIVIKSDEADPAMLQQVRQQFMAAINGVQSAWRMPIFSVGMEDNVTWQAIDSSSRDMEFQYLSDNNARCILSAYQMSPEELPGFAHLARGTNSQALAESNNQWKLEAARDVGIRPLVANFEDFLNDEILPIVDEALSEVCKIVLAGLDALTQDQEDAEKERLASTDGTMNDVLQKGEKTPLPPELAGDVPLNQVWSAAAQAFVPVGLILEQLLGVKGAKDDPKWQYLRDPFYWQQQESLMNQLQMVLQPPFDVLAPLVLPKLLTAVFGIDAEKAQVAAQQIVQTAQMLAQQQMMAGAQGQGEQQGQPAQKSEAFAFMRHRQNFLVGLPLPAPPRKSN